MNTITANAMIYQEDISSKAKSIFQYLAFRSNKNNTCFPGLKTIAKDCSISVSSVQRGLRELLSLGFIRKKHNYRENGSQTSNIYEVIEDVMDRVQTAKENLQQQIREMRRRASFVKEKKKQVEMDLVNRDCSEKEKKGEVSRIRKVLKLFKFKCLTRGAGQFDHPIT